MENKFIYSNGCPFILLNEKDKKYWNSSDIDAQFQVLTTSLEISQEAIEKIEVQGFNFLAVVEPENILKINNHCFIQIYACDFDDDIVDLEFIKNIIHSKNPKNSEIYDISLNIGNYLIFSSNLTYDDAISSKEYIQMQIFENSTKIFWSYYQLNDFWFSYFLFGNRKDELFIE